ncbi:hypothetical protein J6590_001969 [Homalodisca vitripennis]|nr:hypothetical protein J6590_001969 [Homalodisca vitripennis]
MPNEEILNANLNAATLSLISEVRADRLPSAIFTEEPINRPNCSPKLGSSITETRKSGAVLPLTKRTQYQHHTAELKWYRQWRHRHGLTCTAFLHAADTPRESSGVRSVVCNLPTLGIDFNSCPWDVVTYEQVQYATTTIATRVRGTVGKVSRVAARRRRGEARVCLLSFSPISNNIW